MVFLRKFDNEKSSLDYYQIILYFRGRLWLYFLFTVNLLTIQVFWRSNMLEVLTKCRLRFGWNSEIYSYSRSTCTTIHAFQSRHREPRPSEAHERKGTACSKRVDLTSSTESAKTSDFRIVEPTSKTHQSLYRKQGTSRVFIICGAYITVTLPIDLLPCITQTS